MLPKEDIEHDLLQQFEDNKITQEAKASPMINSELARDYPITIGRNLPEVGRNQIRIGLNPTGMHPVPADLVAARRRYSNSLGRQKAQRMQLGINSPGHHLRQGCSNLEKD